MAKRVHKILFHLTYYLQSLVWGSIESSFVSKKSICSGHTCHEALINHFASLLTEDVINCVGFEDRVILDETLRVLAAQLDEMVTCGMKLC